MDKSKILFWNVDTQYDFIEPDGKLYVKGAEEIRPFLRKITDFARLDAIRVINTCDWHFPNSAELSKNPDFVTSFPEHCMAGTPGAEFIAETLPEFPTVIDWDGNAGIYAEPGNYSKYRNIVIRKDAFDVFAGNPHVDKIVQILNPEKVFTYGVTTNVCVDKAVTGLTDRGIKVYVFEDAIKELPNIPLPFYKWRNMGIELISFADARKYF